MVNAFNFKPFNKRKKKKENAPKLNKVVPHKYFESHNSDAVCVFTLQLPLVVVT